MISQSIKKVMISSTVRDLPVHRQQVMDACLRQGMFPVMMEHLPANDEEAISSSVNMVDEADIYVGVFGDRYGYVPKAGNPSRISVTEMEYNRAVERAIPRLIFIMDKTHPIQIEDTEMGEGSEKLKAFKERILHQNVVNFFQSPQDLRALAINSLSQSRLPNLNEIHYISEIPRLPEPYIAHPYTLLQTRWLIGRQKELELLGDWVSNSSEEVYQARIVSVVAIGGMGKSALAWKWFNEIAPLQMKQLVGRIWWSFYESDARFENFILRATAYVTERAVEEVKRIPTRERESLLLATLSKRPFLIVLDGLERILVAYARMDAAYLRDFEFGYQRNPRKTTDPRAGSFLRKLAQLKNSRVLISSRLYPASLETDGGDEIPGCFRLDIGGLDQEDAIELWSAFNVTGSREELLSIFTTFNRHPLLLQILAGEVKRYHRAPSDFTKWRKANPRFNPSRFPRLQEAMGHVLEYSLSGLDKRGSRVLYTIAAFRMPARYDTISELLAGTGKLCNDEQELDTILTELEDRGLLGWDKRANRYDLHPIVRSVVWSGLIDEARRGVYATLYDHFNSLPPTDGWRVNSIDELTPAIELYYSLINLEKYDEAYEFIADRLRPGLYYRLGEYEIYRQCLELLIDEPNSQDYKLKEARRRAFIYNNLANSLSLSGRPKDAIPCLEQAIQLELESNTVRVNYPVHIGNLGIRCLFPLGRLVEAEQLVRHRIEICMKSYLSLRNSEDSEKRQVGRFHRRNAAIGHSDLGYILSLRGLISIAKPEFSKALQIFRDRQSKGIVHALRGRAELKAGQFSRAMKEATMARNMADDLKMERDIIRSESLIGAAALGLGMLYEAEEHIHLALNRARAKNLVEEELQALIVLAEYHQRRGDVTTAREFLNEVYEIAERGSYRLLESDALNVRAQIERNHDHQDAAVEAATRAYRLAWCDGPPYAYHWGLEAARKHLRELGAPEPEMPPFDESNYEPVPETKIDLE